MTTHPSGRKFAVEMIVDGQPTAMKVCNDQDSVYYGVYFVEIPQEWVTQAKEYSLRVKVLKKETEAGGLTYT